MAQVKLTPVPEPIRGRSGDLVLEGWGDETVIARRAGPDGVQPTAAELAHGQRCREAVRLDRMVLGDPESKALYGGAALPGRARGNEFLDTRPPKVLS
ncbi:MAG: hypothetical protein AB1505_31115 [Candidatus Latescibacterota bacterium]